MNNNLENDFILFAFVMSIQYFEITMYSKINIRFILIADINKFVYLKNN